MDTPTALSEDTHRHTLAEPIPPGRSRLLRAAVGMTANEPQVLVAGGDGRSAPVAVIVWPTATHRCPKCVTPLFDHAGVGKCHRCGFTKVLDVVDQLPPLAPRPSPLGVVELVQIILALPGWLSVLVAGAAAVVLYVVALGNLLPDAPLARAAWGNPLLLISLAVFALCHLWVLVKLIPTNDRLGLRDLLDVFGLWKLSVRNLPETRWPIWLGTWALAAAVCSVAVIGGQVSWLAERLPADTRVEAPAP